MKSLQLVEAHRSAAAYYQRQLRDDPDGWAAQHLRERGLGAVLSEGSSWRIGFAPEGWSRLVNHLRQVGFSDEVMLEAGLASVTGNGYLLDRFRNRIVFAAHDAELRSVGFVGRSSGRRLRYLNTPNTPIYSKSRAVVGLDAQVDSLRAGAIPVLVEGPMDALAISQLGDDWAGVAVCGTAITREHAMIVRAHTRANSVVVGLDGNGAGQAGAIRSLDALSDAFDEVLFAALPIEQDPASLFLADPQRLGTALRWSRPLIDFAIDVELERWRQVLDHISGQVNATRAVAPLVARLPRERIAGELTRLAGVLHLDEQIVSREVVAAVGRPASRRVAQRTRSTGVDPGDCSRTPGIPDPGSELGL